MRKILNVLLILLFTMLMCGTTAFAAPSVTFIPEDSTILIEQGKTLTLEAVPDGYDYKTVEWKSDNTNVTVSNSGTLKTTLTAVGKVGDTSTITVTLKGDAPSPFDTTITVRITQLPPPAITTESLPDAFEGVDYEATIVATGDSGLFSWVIPSGSLPVINGLEQVGFVGASTTIKGKPTADAVTASPITLSVTAQGTVEKVEKDFEINVYKQVTKITMVDELVLDSGDNYTFTVASITTVPVVANDVLLWSSSNEEIVTVDEDGIATAKKTGTATITAMARHDDKVFDTCEVTVLIPLVPGGITIFADPLGISGNFSVTAKDDNITLRAEFNPPDTTSTDLVWSTNDSLVVYVNPATGRITPGNIGTATIHANIEGVSQGNVVITVGNRVNVTDIDLLPEALYLYEGSVATLSYEVIPPNATSKDLTWSSSNVAVASVDQTGVVKGISSTVASGQANITVTADPDGAIPKVVTFPLIVGTKPAIAVPSADLKIDAMLPPGFEKADLVIPITDDAGQITAITKTLGIVVGDLDFSPTDPIVLKDSSTEDFIEELFGTTVNYDYTPLPVFQALLKTPGNTAAVAFNIKGEDLLVERPENVKLLKVLETDGTPAHAELDFFTYVGTAAEFADKTFTILDATTHAIHTDDIDLDPTPYVLLVMIQDGEKFDLDGFENGVVWDPAALIKIELDDLEVRAIREDGVSFDIASGGTIDLPIGSKLDLVGKLVPESANDFTKVEWVDPDLPRAVTVTQDTNDVYKAVVTTDQIGKSLIQFKVDSELFPFYVNVTGIPVIPVTGVTIDKPAITLNVSGSETLTATVAPTDATNKAVTWSITPTSVATVSSAGLVTGVAAGTATVTVRTTDGGYTDTCTVTVNAVPDPEIRVTPGTLSLEVGKTATISYDIVPPATVGNIGWVVDDISIATIDTNGVVSAIKAGTTEIRAQGTDLTRTTQVISNPCTLTVTATDVSADSVVITPKPITLDVGASQTLTATISPTNATDQRVSWSIAPTGVATISQAGLVEGVAAGSATVTVTTLDGGHIDTCAVTVNTVNVPVDSVSLNKSTMTLIVGASETLTATVLPTNASEQGVIWSIAPAGVATVDNGVVTAVAEGTATITVLTVSGAKAATCTVTVTDGNPEFPSDKNEVAAKTGINANDLVEVGGRVFLSGNAATAVAKALLGSSAEVGTIEPIFSKLVNPDGTVALLSVVVKGSDLLARYADDISLVGLMSAGPGRAAGGSGRLFDYANSITDLGDMKYTLLKNNAVYTGVIDPNDTYELVFGIKDGGVLDLSNTGGEVLASVFLASDGKKGSGGGCSAGYGLLALALLGAAPLIRRKRQ